MKNDLVRISTIGLGIIGRAITNFEAKRSVDLDGIETGVQRHDTGRAVAMNDFGVPLGGGPPSQVIVEEAESWGRGENDY